MTLTKELIDETYETANHALELMRVPYRIKRQDVVLILHSERVVQGIDAAFKAES